MDKQLAQATVQKQEDQGKYREEFEKTASSYKNAPMLVCPDRAEFKRLRNCGNRVLEEEKALICFWGELHFMDAPACQPASRLKRRCG